MTQLDEKIEEFHPLVGFDVCNKFENRIEQAVIDLSDALKASFMDGEAKTNYATHVFAKMLDELGEMLENPGFMN